MGRTATPEDLQLANDRLKGNGAWRGNGLAVFLASTSRKDPERGWMEPLKDLCERISFGAEDNGLETVSLSDDDAACLDELATYSATFHQNEADGPTTVTDPPAAEPEAPAPSDE